MPLLKNDSWRRSLSQCVDQACFEIGFDLVAFVFMPDHVHLLTFPRDDQPDFGLFLARIKQPFSKEIKRTLVESNSPLLKKLTIRERPGKWSFRFWQEGPGYDRNIFTPDGVEASINYIHLNPARRGLCDRAIEWQWSSARYYLLEPTRQQFVELPYVHGIPEGALDEDRAWVR